MCLGFYHVSASSSLQVYFYCFVCNVAAKGLSVIIPHIEVNEVKLVLTYIAEVEELELGSPRGTTPKIYCEHNFYLLKPPFKWTTKEKPKYQKSILIPPNEIFFKQNRFVMCWTHFYGSTAAYSRTYVFLHHLFFILRFKMIHF